MSWRRSGITLVLVLGLVAPSAVALAGDHEGNDSADGDTLFNFGYDPLNHVFLHNVTRNDSLFDCTLANGRLTATYGEADGAVTPVDGLEDGEGVVSFEPRPEEDLPEGVEPAEAPVVYSGSDGECGVTGGVVAGPNGQINHGQFLKLFKQLIDMRGHGCLVRWLAKSELGKDAQKIRTPEVDEAFEPADSGAVEFTTADATCDRPKKDKGEDHPGRGQSKGHAKNGERPGKSGDAPGHNK